MVYLLKQEAVGAKKQQGSAANSPKPEPARAQTPCAKPSPLPSSRDGPPSLLMPPSPPLQQACYARTPPPTTTWMVSSHHGAKSLPTCHVSPLPVAEPQPPLKEHGLDLATQGTKKNENVASSLPLSVVDPTSMANVTVVQGVQQTMLPA